MIHRTMIALGVLAMLATTASAEKQAKKPKKYSISVKANPAGVEKGKAASYVLTITPKEGYELKTETPFKANLTGSDGVKIDKTMFTNKDYDDNETAAKSLSTPFTAGNAGSSTITADLTFFICDPNMCERFKDETVLSIAVTEPKS